MGNRAEALLKEKGERISEGVSTALFAKGGQGKRGRATLKGEVKVEGIIQVTS